jgi:hypothetical protein
MSLPWDLLISCLLRGNLSKLTVKMCCNNSDPDGNIELWAPWRGQHNSFLTQQNNVSHSALMSYMEVTHTQHIGLLFHAPGAAL